MEKYCSGCKAPYYEWDWGNGSFGFCTNCWDYVEKRPEFCSYPGPGIVVNCDINELYTVEQKLERMLGVVRHLISVRCKEAEACWKP